MASNSNEEVIYFSTTEGHSVSACSECDKFDLRSTILCIFPNLGVLRTNHYDFVQYNGEKVWIYLYQHFLRPMTSDISMMSEFAYDHIVTDFMNYIDSGHSIFTSDNNNFHEDLNFNLEYVKPNLSESRRAHLDRWNARCFCLSHSR